MAFIRQLILGLSFGLSLVAGARADDAMPAPYDPLESVNRATFGVNDAIDMVIINPLVTIWNGVLPQPVRQGVSNEFDNLDDVYAGINHALQGRGSQASTDFSRVIVNTTVGIGGIFDVGTKIGLKKSYGDFGQTLGVWGFSTGPYVVLPLLGPSTLRETAGRGARIATDARNLLPTNTFYALSGTEYLATRADAKANEGLIAASSLDRYVFVRNLYWQRRFNLVQEGRNAGAGSSQP